MELLDHVVVLFFFFCVPFYTSTNSAQGSNFATSWPTPVIFCCCCCFFNSSQPDRCEIAPYFIVWLKKKLTVLSHKLQYIFKDLFYFLYYLFFPGLSLLSLVFVKVTCRVVVKLCSGTLTGLDCAHSRCPFRRTETNPRGSVMD